jgi:acyl-coenzyme A thioesterase PaaI-like protein
MVRPIAFCLTFRLTTSRLLSILEVVKTHFNTTLAKQNQPHTIALHVEFLRRTQAGPATYKVDDVKLGRQTSIVHVTMEQDGRQEVVAYVTNSNMDTETGFTQDVGYELSPPVPSVDLAKLEKDEDLNWRHQAELPHANFRKATKRVSFYLPRGKRAFQHVADEWICFSDGSNFTDSSIGFVADMFPLMVESIKGEGEGPFWYPTLLLNLDLKKALPPQGVKWLQIRAEMKKVKNGRMDLEVFVHDAQGELVALSHHIAFVLDASRNTAARKTGNAKI